MTDVVVIGAGAAGLAAAHKLSQAGARVEILEARTRLGGRIHTVPSTDRFVPFELGAEFVHGTNHITWDFVRKGGFGVRKVLDEHWVYPPMCKQSEFWSSLETCIAGVNFNTPDKSFDQFLRERPSPCADEGLVRLFVEGFDAADTRKISSHSLKKASEDEGQDSKARLERGEGALIVWLETCSRNQGVGIQLNTRVRAIRWHAHDVEVVADINGSEATWRAPQVVITLPLGVLKANAVAFEPALPTETQSAIDGMEMGNVVKLVFEFDEAFWKHRLGAKNFGFIHSQFGPLRTWWSRPLAPILVGWVGGPQATEITDHIGVAERALKQLSDFAEVPLATVKTAMRQWRSHNWTADPLSEGAYSYVGVGNMDAPEKFRQPIDDTLFFAGEHTSDIANLGTVHGALQSGVRVAESVREMAF
ncbi:MAG: amine oxidase [Verrucomicrobiales bacterium]|nr:amine oxidase [Verrucomicrobiales bacterium]